MPDEENDKIIKEAADHYHPAYDEKAWEKMEQLLNLNLPQKKKKRKIIFFIFPLLLAGGLIFYIAAENGKNSSLPAKKITNSTNKTEKSIPVPATSHLPGAIITGLSAGERESYQQPPGKKKNVLKMLTTNARKNITSIGKANIIYPVEKNTQENSFNNNHVSSPDETIINQGDTRDPSKSNSVVERPSASSVVTSSNQKNILNQKEIKQDTQLPIQVVNEPGNIAKAEKNQSITTKKETKRSKNNFAKNFGISLSAGPDISGAQLDNPGRIAINLGLGLSYVIAPAFTLRAGFYADKKIYSVVPDDYKATNGTGNYEYLQNIDANCLVYSIPINVNYNFKKIKNHNWFLSTGLSSYLMKRETYKYYYKYPSGQTNTKNWTIHNQNQNFLSMLNLSGGYQYYFNNRISVMGEPYLNLPLSGVGAGKVRLKSGGILLTVTVNAFLKKGK